MNSKSFLRCFLLLVGVCSLQVLSEDRNRYFLAAAKSVPRIGRSPGKIANSEFEKFFLKASKSVPRIGRGNEDYRLADEGASEYSNWGGDSMHLYDQPEGLLSNAEFRRYFQQFLVKALTGQDPDEDSGRSRVERSA